MRRLGVIFVIGCLAGLSLTPARAEHESCTFDGSKVRVRLFHDDSSAALSVLAGAITMNGDPCELATVINTDEINVRDTSNGGSTGIIIDLSGGHFSSGGAEIPFVINLRTGTRDTFGVIGESGDDFITFGRDGANLQDDGEAEVSFQSSPDAGLVAAQDGADRVCAKGGHGTGDKSPMLWAMSGGQGADKLCGGGGVNFLTGSGGADRLIGDDGPDVLRGRGGSDDLAGKRGNDRLFGGSGDDSLHGGRGIDHCRGGSGSDQLTSC